MAKPLTVRLGRTLLEALERTAWQAAPHEACGLILGDFSEQGADITGIVMTDNVTSGDPTTSFEVDPATHIFLQKAARTGGPSILGVWHSHPGGLARPSDADKAQSLEPGWIWLISADGEGAMEHAAFRAGTPEPHSFEDCVLELVEHP